MTSLVIFPEFISFNGDDVCLHEGKRMYAEKTRMNGEEK